MDNVIGNQTTLRSAISATGTGLFTGQRVTITLAPADPGAGIVFRRSDLEGAADVPARVEHVVEAPRHTVLARGAVRIETTEHVLSALAGAGVDHAIVALDGPEVPAFDGSAQPFVEMIDAVGIELLPERRTIYHVREEVRVDDEHGSIVCRPGAGDELMVAYRFDGGADCPIRPHMVELALTPASYRRELAPARTFSTLAEAQAARARGLFAHLTPTDMLVIGPDGPIENALRYPDEPARHKLVDLVGDLALAGVRVTGRIEAHRSGHALNAALARELGTRWRET